MTILNRRSFIAKRGHRQEVIDMLIAGEKKTANRILSAHYGPFDTVVFEAEFANMVEMEAIWSEWYASEGGRQFMARWSQITESGGVNDVWKLTHHSAGDTAKFINRRTFQAKTGQTNALVDHLSVGANQLANIPPYRISYSLFGAGSRVALEIEFPDLGAYDEFWLAFLAAPDTPAYMEQFNQLVEPEWVNELWQVH